MSLARTLIQGSDVAGALDVSMYYTGKATMESSWLDYACESLHMDIFNANKAYLVADVMGEVQVIKEGADPEVLLENILTSGFEKLKEAFKKFLAKIKEWFKKVKEWFKTFYLTGKDFTKEFASRIRKKANTEFGRDYKYHGYKFTISKGKGISDNLFGKCEDKVADILGNMTDVATRLAHSINGNTPDEAKKNAENLMPGWSANNATASSTVNGTYNVSMSKPGASARSTRFTKDTASSLTDEKIIDALANKDKMFEKDTSEFIDDFVGKHVSGADSVSEAKRIMNEAYRNEESSASDYTFAEGNSVDDMISAIDTCQKNIDQAEKEERRFESIVKKITDKLDRLAADKKAMGDAPEAGYKVAAKCSSYINGLLTVAKDAVNEEVTAYKDCAKQSETVLKAFLRAGKGGVPLKESYEEDEDVEEGCKKATTEGVDLMEMAYNYL